VQCSTQLTLHLQKAQSYQQHAAHVGRGQQISQNPASFNLNSTVFHLSCALPGTTLYTQIADDTKAADLSVLHVEPLVSWCSYMVGHSAAPETIDFLGQVQADTHSHTNLPLRFSALHVAATWWGELARLRGHLDLQLVCIAMHGKGAAELAALHVAAGSCRTLLCVWQPVVGARCIRHGFNVEC
jgi:hypothetical protein